MMPTRSTAWEATRGILAHSCGKSTAQRCRLRAALTPKSRNPRPERGILLELDVALSVSEREE
jgi:hypothetical protein